MSNLLRTFRFSVTKKDAGQNDINLKKKCNLGLLRRSKSTLFLTLFSHSYVAISYWTICALFVHSVLLWRRKKCKKHACTAGNKKADIYDINVVDEATVISLGEKNLSKKILIEKLHFMFTCILFSIKWKCKQNSKKRKWMMSHLKNYICQFFAN